MIILRFRYAFRSATSNLFEGLSTGANKKIMHPNTPKHISYKITGNPNKVKKIKVKMSIAADDNKHLILVLASWKMPSKQQARQKENI